MGGRSSEGWGVYRRRYRLFLVVKRPEPSVLTPYWWYCRTSTTIPVLSHLVGWRPAWFCILTASPTFSGVRPAVCSSHLAFPAMDRFDSAFSLRFSVSVQVRWGTYLVGLPGRRSRVGRSNTHIAGDDLVSGSGLFR